MFNYQFIIHAKRSFTNPITRIVTAYSVLAVNGGFIVTGTMTINIKPWKNSRTGTIYHPNSQFIPSVDNR